MRPFQAAILILLGHAALAPAIAADCKKQRDPATKAICTSPTAKAVDVRMSAALEKLNASMDSQQLEALTTDQRDWLKRRDLACTGARADAASCLSVANDLRTRDLTGTPVSGPGTGSALTPVFKGMNGSASTLTWHALLFRFANPASASERGFNDVVDEKLSHVPRNVGVPLGLSGAYLQRGTIAYASPEIVSVRVDVSENADDDPQGRTWTENMNYDLRRDRPLTAASTFTREGLATLRETCLNQVARSMTAKRGTDGHEPLEAMEEETFIRRKVQDVRGDIDKVTSDASHWEFGPDALTVTYDVDTVGRHSEGAYACRVGYDALRAMARPDATLPPVAVVAATGG